MFYEGKTIYYSTQHGKETQSRKLFQAALGAQIYVPPHYPFQDGNGQWSRALTTLLLLQERYAYVSYPSLESVIESREEEYYAALRRTQGTIRSDAPDWEQWILFFLSSLLRQKRNLDWKSEREKILLTQLPELSVKIIELAHEHGRVTIGEAIALTGISRNTLVTFRNLLKKTVW
jgi:Fic family protein